MFSDLFSLLALFGLYGLVGVLGLLGLVILKSLVVLYPVENKVRKIQKGNFLMIKWFFYHFSGYNFQKLYLEGWGNLVTFPPGGGGFFSHVLQLI